MPRLRFMLVAAVLVVAGGLLVAAPVGAQTSPDLKAAALAPSDLEPSWQVRFELPVDGESYTVVLGRRSHEALGILLVNDPLREISPARMLDLGESELRSAARAAPSLGGVAAQVTVEQVAPVSTSEEASQARVGLTMATGEALSGAVLAWRQGPVVVAMYYLTDQTADLAPRAEQQRAKLATVLSAAMQTGASGSGASVASSRPTGRVICTAILVAWVSTMSVLGGRTGSVMVQAPSETVCIITS